jgi:hypothetical protein
LPIFRPFLPRGGQLHQSAQLVDGCAFGHAGADVFGDRQMQIAAGS